MKKFLRNHLHATVLLGIVLVLATIPVIDTFLILGDSWQGIVPTFGDETVYTAHLRTIEKGYLNDGNPYLFEHRYDPPLVVFGGAWLNALPLIAGLPFTTALFMNFILWSVLFAGTLYWLFRELRVPPWIAVFGTILLYLQSYGHVWRPVNLQPVYPFYFLFYAALVRLIREQNRRNILVLAFATGTTFYLFAYLWQTVVITLGLLFLYALVRKDWPLVQATLLSSLLGGAIGLPVPLYTLWLSRSSPYFWESISRFGLVNTHLPMAEVIYSGGWIGILLAVVAILYWRVRRLYEDREFVLAVSFISISGLGLWIMQGSNLITGKLLETGEHVKLLILPWLMFSTVVIGTYLWRRRTQLTTYLRVLSCIVIAACFTVSLQYTYYYFSPFFKIEAHREFWQTEQTYAKPLAWLDQNEKSPVVVWSDPRLYLTPNISVFTKHFILYTPYALWQLVSDDEIRERYLVSQYFNDPIAADLTDDMAAYLGRQDAYHNAKTVERGIKICKIVFFWDKNKDCGVPPTPVALLGGTFFSDLENKFQREIKPNIKEYLKKYNVSYILKDKILNPSYRPEALGAVRVYTDDRYELYHLP